IKIVVYMHAIHIIAAHYIQNHTIYIISHFGNTGIKICLTGVMDQPFRMGFSNMIGRIGIRLARYQCPERIEPGMKLHIALMRFFYHKCQRVVIWEGRLPLLTTKVSAPWLYSARVERICGRTNLNDYCIKSMSSQKIQMCHKLILLLRSTESLLRWPVDIADRSYPNRSKLSFRRLRPQHHS